MECERKRPAVWITAVATTSHWPFAAPGLFSITRGGLRPDFYQACDPDRQSWGRPRRLKARLCLRSEPLSRRDLNPSSKLANRHAARLSVRRGFGQCASELPLRTLQVCRDSLLPEKGGGRDWSRLEVPSFPPHYRRLLSFPNSINPSFATSSGTFLMVHLLGLLSVWDGQVWGLRNLRHVNVSEYISTG